MHINNQISFGARIKFDSSISREARTELNQLFAEDKEDELKISGSERGSVSNLVSWLSDMEGNDEINLTFSYVDHKVTAKLDGKWKSGEDFLNKVIHEIKGVEKPGHFNIAHVMFKLANTLVLRQGYKYEETPGQTQSWVG